jgi:lipopolysaccharide biosynthesis regulator YciM
LACECGPACPDRKTCCTVQLPECTGIKEAYKTVVKNWPNSRWVETALLELGRMSFDEAQLADAIMYLEMLLEKSPEKVCLVGNDLSAAYDQMGDVEMAELVRAELAERNCPGR